MKEKIAAQLSGEPVNNTENRAVLHTALRMGLTEELIVNGKDVIEDIKSVRWRIEGFADKIRDGKITGYGGHALKNVVCIGIGGSFLGPEFVYEALRDDPMCREASKGMTLRFLANVDPIDFFRATDGLDV